MYKLTAIYKKPDNVEEFEKHFKEVHTPLCQKIPKLKTINVTKITGSPFGQSDIHMICELCFENKENFKEAMSSPENMACGKDLGNFAKGKVEVLFSKEEA